jgi:hypothetical protein
MSLVKYTLTLPPIHGNFMFEGAQLAPEDFMPCVQHGSDDWFNLERMEHLHNLLFNSNDLLQQGFYTMVRENSWDRISYVYKQKSLSELIPKDINGVLPAIVKCRCQPSRCSLDVHTCASPMPKSWIPSLMRKLESPMDTRDFIYKGLPEMKRLVVIICLPLSNCLSCYIHVQHIYFPSCHSGPLRYSFSKKCSHEALHAFVQCTRNKMIILGTRG